MSPVVGLELTLAVNLIVEVVLGAIVFKLIAVMGSVESVPSIVKESFT
nr:hypothetical protein [Clostridium niameyense]